MKNKKCGKSVFATWAKEAAGERKQRSGPMRKTGPMKSPFVASCPFCGAKDPTVTVGDGCVWYVRCGNCYAQGPASEESIGDAEQLWNNLEGVKTHNRVAT